MKNRFSDLDLSEIVLENGGKPKGSRTREPESRLIRVVARRVGMPPEVLEIEPSLQAMQALVGGYIERVPLFPSKGNRPGVDLWVDEEGLLKRKPLNFVLEGTGPIVGDVFFAGSNDRTGKTVSLSEDQIEFLLERTVWPSHGDLTKNPVGQKYELRLALPPPPLEGKSRGTAWAQMADHLTTVLGHDVIDGERERDSWSWFWEFSDRDEALEAFEKLKDFISYIYSAYNITVSDLSDPIAPISGSRPYGKTLASAVGSGEEEAIVGSGEGFFPVFSPKPPPKGGGPRGSGVKNPAHFSGQDRAAYVFAEISKQGGRARIDQLPASTREIHDLIRDGELEQEGAYVSLASRENPSRNMDALYSRAYGLYKRFHKKEPKREVMSNLVIPEYMYRVGKAEQTLYRSDKLNPETLEDEGTIDYFHDHDGGVGFYLGEKYIGEMDPPPKRVKVPKRIVEAKALVVLGKCLGFTFSDGGHDVPGRGTYPFPELCALPPNGSALLVIQNRKSVIAMIWGGKMTVRPEGITG